MKKKIEEAQNFLPKIQCQNVLYITINWTQYSLKSFREIQEQTSRILWCDKSSKFNTVQPANIKFLLVWVFWIIRISVTELMAIAFTKLSAVYTKSITTFFFSSKIAILGGLFASWMHFSSITSFYLVVLTRQVNNFVFSMAHTVAQWH